MWRPSLELSPPGLEDGNGNKLPGLPQSRGLLPAAEHSPHRCHGNQWGLSQRLQGGSLTSESNRDNKHLAQLDPKKSSDRAGQSSPLGGQTHALGAI